MPVAIYIGLQFMSSSDLYRDIGRHIDTREIPVYIGQSVKRGLRMGYGVNRMPWSRGRQRESKWYS